MEDNLGFHLNKTKNSVSNSVTTFTYRKANENKLRTQ